MSWGADSSSVGLTAGLLLALTGIGVLAFAFWLWMLVDCLSSKLPPTEKLMWVIVIVFLSFLGAMVYMLVGRSKEKPLGKSVSGLVALHSAGGFRGERGTVCCDFYADGACGGAAASGGFGGTMGPGQFHVTSADGKPVPDEVARELQKRMEQGR